MNKKVYVCNKCENIRIINDNEYINKCNKCGNEVKQIYLNFEPKTFSSIKKYTTLEINIDKVKEILYNVLNDKLETNKIFIPSGVIKIIFDKNLICYIYFYKKDNMIHMEQYDLNKYQDFLSFSLQFAGDVTFKDYNNLLIDDNYTLENTVAYPYYDINKKMDKRHAMQAQGTIDAFTVVQSIFTYLSTTREVENITEHTNKNDFISVHKGNKEIKKYHKIINMNDNIKIYTYDSTMAHKIRHHKFKCEWWEVRPFIRRKFDKRDKDLPINERRVISFKYINGFLKGEKRNEHEFGEQTNKKYIIKEK